MAKVSMIFPEMFRTDELPMGRYRYAPEPTPYTARVCPKSSFILGIPIPLAKFTVPPNPRVVSSTNANRDCMARRGFPCNREFTKDVGRERLYEKFAIGEVIMLGSFLQPFAIGRKRYFSKARPDLNW